MKIRVTDRKLCNNKFTWCFHKAKQDNSVICMLSLRGLFFIVLRAMFIIFGFYNKTIIGFRFCFFPLELYNKTISGFGFCDM